MEICGSPFCRPATFSAFPKNTFWHSQGNLSVFRSLRVILYLSLLGGCIAFSSFSTLSCLPPPFWCYCPAVFKVSRKFSSWASSWRRTYSEFGKNPFSPFNCSILTEIMTEVEQPPQNGIDPTAGEDDDNSKARPADIEQVSAGRRSPNWITTPPPNTHHHHFTFSSSRICAKWSVASESRL